MASTSISVVTTLISGAAAISTSNVGAASGETCTLTGPSGGPLDFNSLAIRIANEATGSGALVTISASSTYSGLEAGTYSVTVGTADTVYIGGTDFESARFLQSSMQSIVLTFTTTTGSAVTACCALEAVQAPYAHTG